MSKRLWIVLSLGALLFVAAIGAAGAGFLLVWPRIQSQKALERADAALAAGEWAAAKRDYAWYLTNQRQLDKAVLEKYAQASLNMPANRRATLRDAGRAYFQLASNDLTNADALDRVLDFYLKQRLWGDLEYAADFFRRRNIKRGDLTYLHALALDRQGRTGDAIQSYQSLIEAGDAPLDVYGNLARLMREQGLTQQARILLDEALAKHPDTAEIHAARAEFFAASNDKNGAAAELDKALALAPESAKILLSAARVAETNRDWDAAIDYAERARSAGDASVEVYQILGSAYERQGEIQKAIALLEGLDPMMLADSFSLYLSLAELHLAARNLDAARTTRAGIAKSYPDSRSILEYLEAREHLMEGDAERAIPLFVNAVQGAPDFDRAQFYLAVAYLEANRKAEARTTLETYRRRRPDNEAAAVLWESAFGGPRSLAEGVATAQAQLTDERPSPESMVMTARFLMRQYRSGVTDAETRRLAEEVLTRALELDPANANAGQTFAELLLDAGDPSRARTMLEQVRAAGAQAKALEWAEAAIAISEGGIEKAFEMARTALERPEAVSGDVVRWADLLAMRAGLEHGLRLLDAAEAVRDGAWKAELAPQRVALVRQYGALEDALGMLDAAAEAVRGNQGAEEQLNSERLNLARRLVLAGPEQDRARGDALIAHVEEAEPANLVAKLLRAQYHLSGESPNYSAASALASRVLESDPNDGSAYLILHDAAIREGRLVQALDYAQRAVELMPRSASAQLALAETHLRLGHPPEAREILERLQPVFPTDARLLELLARAYGAMNQNAQAEAMLNRMDTLAQNDPAHAEAAASVRALLYSAGSKWTEAESVLRAQLEAQPDDLSVVQALARALAGQNRASEAEALLQDYAEKHPGEARAWSALGEYIYASGRKDGRMEASSAFTRALVAQPDYPPALRGLIELESTSGNTGNALALCERYLALNPNDIDVIYNQSVLLAQAPNRTRDALASIERAIAIEQRPEYIQFRGLLNTRLGNYRQAVEDLQRVRSLQTNAAFEMEAALVEAYIGLSEFDLARRYMAVAQEKADTDARKTRLSALLEKLPPVEGAQ